MTLEVLVSCMGQKDFSLVSKLGIVSDALFINQCAREEERVQKNGAYRIRMLSARDRGLSKSRNLAIQKASGTICLFCDDDVRLNEHYRINILNAFSENPQADLIVFSVSGLGKRLKPKAYRLRYLDLLKVSSVQIAFRREAVLASGVRFDPFMGAGSGNGAQEENKFLMDCYKAGLSIYHVPIEIGTLIPKESTWFHGYDRNFFYLRGTATRYLLGLPLSLAYAFYYIISKRKLYSNDIPPLAALSETIRGCIQNDIEKQKKRSIEE